MKVLETNTNLTALRLSNQVNIYFFIEGACLQPIQ